MYARKTNVLCIGLLSAVRNLINLCMRFLSEIGDLAVPLICRASVVQIGYG